MYDADWVVIHLHRYCYTLKMPQEGKHHVSITRWSNQIRPVYDYYGEGMMDGGGSALSSGAETRAASTREGLMLLMVEHIYLDASKRRGEHASVGRETSVNPDQLYWRMSR